MSFVVKVPRPRILPIHEDRSTDVVRRIAYYSIERVGGAQRGRRRGIPDVPDHERRYHRRQRRRFPDDDPPAAVVAVVAVDAARDAAIDPRAADPTTSTATTTPSTFFKQAVPFSVASSRGPSMSASSTTTSFALCRGVVSSARSRLFRLVPPR